MSQGSTVKPTVLVKKIKVVKNTDLLNIKSLYKEDLLYESREGDFLKLDTRLVLFNKFNLITKNSITIARYGSGPVVEKTSEGITRLIGQNNYDTLFSALCSVINHELKIRSILALLTEPKTSLSAVTQTEKANDSGGTSKYVDEKACQTDETYIGLYKKEKPKRRLRRVQPTPYVVTDPKKQPVKKVVISPEDFKDFPASVGPKIIDPPIFNPQTKPSMVMEEKLSDIEIPQLDLNEDSNDSVGNCSTFTVNTWASLEKDPLQIIKSIQNVTKPDDPPKIESGVNSVITLLDGTTISVPMKIEDRFHIATPDIIKCISLELRRKVLWYQAYIDWKYCLTKDEDNHLPIHVAAMNSDIDMLRRQCVVLKTRNESVDVPAGENMTALQISIYGGSAECTAMLLSFGADPLAADDEYRTCFHLAAEAGAEHLRALTAHCGAQALKILQDNEELWKPELASKPKEYLRNYLMRKISTMFDNQGYTPLMLACQLGKHENVKTLLEAVSETVNTQMPNSGNTALYLAVAAACMDSSNRCNKSTVSEDFKKTIELLVEYGADPSIDNHSGANVNTILADLKVGELSMIIANKMTNINCYGDLPSGSKKFDKVMLVKQEDGSLNVKNISKTIDKVEKQIVSPKKEPQPVIIKTETLNVSKPILLENIILTPLNKANIKIDVDADGPKDPNLYMNKFKMFVENISEERTKIPVITNIKLPIDKEKFLQNTVIVSSANRQLPIPTDVNRKRVADTNSTLNTELNPTKRKKLTQLT